MFNDSPWKQSSRRKFLESTGLGFGCMAASYLLGAADAQAAAVSNPLAAKAPPLPATAKNIIFLFMHGGPSHLETFDPKPLLNELEGNPVPESFGDVQLQFSEFRKQPILGCRRTFKKYGQAGIEISDLFPNVAQHADDLAVVRSCYHDGFTHTAALILLNNGWPRLGRPSMGSWLTYGLGSENEDLPAFVVMLEGGIKSGPEVYGSGFLPALYQGTPFRSGPHPILNSAPPTDMGAGEQRQMFDLLRWFNERHMDSRADESSLAARIASYELAYKMQVAAPELTDISKETEATRKLYGVGEEPTSDFGTRCLLARRMVERGVRFVQVWSGNTSGGGDWDGHASCDENHVKIAQKVDKPIAGLLADLKSRGLLEETLVVWSGEFGRTATSDGSLNGGGNSAGRDHNPYGYSMWMAGGGVRGGKVIGATDEIGLHATEKRVHVHDLHASMLRFMGIDHTKLTYFFEGRDYRLTDVAGTTDLYDWLRQG